MARAPVSKTGGWGFEVPPLLPKISEINGLGERLGRSLFLAGHLREPRPGE